MIHLSSTFTNFENTLGEDIIICGVENTTLDATVSNPGDLTNISYKWFKDSIEIPGQTNSTLEITESGIYAAEVTGNGCITTDEINVQLTSFTVSLGEDVSLCEVDSYTITPIIEGEDDTNAIYLWSTGESTSSITVNQPGIYTLEVTINDCVVTDSVFIDLGTIPIIDLGEDFTTCFDFEILLDASPTNMDPADATYEWSLDGNIIPGEITQTLSIIQHGTYTVVVNSGICVTEDAITINPSNDLGIELGDDFTTCFSNPVFLDASPSIGDPNTATYEWSLDGVVLPDTTATLDATEHGTYSVIVTLNGCTDTDSIALIPLGDLGVDLGEDFLTCLEQAITLDATPEIGNVENATYVWTRNGNVMGNQTSATLTTSMLGYYTVEVAIGGCVDTDDINIDRRTNLEVFLDDDFETCPNETHTLTANTSEENATYTWFLNGELILGENGSTLDISLDENTIGTQNYKVKINVGPCVANDNVGVKLYQTANCNISQGISPNGDGLNDRLDLSFLDDRSGIVSFQVFNRLGAVVYDRTSYRKEWKGQSNDHKILPTGTYYYIINFSNEDPVYGNETSGWVYINREEN